MDGLITRDDFHYNIFKHKTDGDVAIIAFRSGNNKTGTPVFTILLFNKYKHITYKRTSYNIEETMKYEIEQIKNTDFFNYYK